MLEGVMTGQALVGPRNNLDEGPLAHLSYLSDGFRQGYFAPPTQP